MSRPAAVAAASRDFDPWLLGLLTATLVATPFLPSEQVTRGGGVLLILASLLGVLAWMLVQLRKGRTDIRLGATDVALAAMLGWHTLAAVIQGGLGQPRAAINVAWQWLAFGAMWFLTRQLARSSAAVRALVAVQLALAVGVSTFGFFQVAYVMPRDRAEFAKDPDSVLRAAGIVAPPGSPVRSQYANRLQSREPIATFALTNSLAGFLVPSLILAAALIYSSAAERRDGDSSTAPRWMSETAAPRCEAESNSATAPRQAAERPSEASATERRTSEPPPPAAERPSGASAAERRTSEPPRQAAERPSEASAAERRTSEPPPRAAERPSGASAAERRTSRALVGFILAGLLIAACVVLTKSRSAYVATAAGSFMLLAAAVCSRRRIGWKIPALAVAVTALLVVVAAALGLLDVQVLSEARKSLGYRFEYWQATLAMIDDRPWLGCGPGNFQLAYAAYKLPQSSEMVADPHNFLLELTATAGLPAVLAFGLALALWTGRIFRRTNELATHSAATETRQPDTRQAVSRQADAGQSPFADRAPRAIYWGAGAGIFLGYVAGAVGGMSPELSLAYTAIPAGMLVLWLLSDWIRRGELTPPVIWIAVAALFVNLLAAGGMGFPAVAHGWWLLGALALNLRDGTATLSRASAPARPFPRAAAWLGLCGLVILIGLFYFTMYRPVISGRLELTLAARAAETGRNEEALERLQDAAELDPWSVEPWSQMAWLHQRDWLANRDSRDLDAAMRAATGALARDQSHVLRMDLGSLFLQSFRQTDDRQSLELASHLYEAANDLYPNHAFGFAQWAWALQLAGQPTQLGQPAQLEAARAAARRALELDDRMPHGEQQLRNRQLVDFPPTRTADRRLPSRPAGANAREYCETLVRQDAQN